MQVAVFHPGTQHSWQTAYALQQLGRLAWYATSIFYKPDEFPYVLERVLPKSLGDRLHAEFRRFSHPGLDPAFVRTSGLAEWLERIAARTNQRRLARWFDQLGNRRFVKFMEQDISSPDPFALWGYSGSSHSVFEAAKRHGRPAILDRTIGDSRSYNATISVVREQFPDWFLPAIGPIAGDQIQRDQMEYELADVILAGSEFAAQTVREHAGETVAAKVRVLPYCFDEALFGAQPIPQPIANDEPVRFLFVGQIHPRKGIQHLLEAVSSLPKGKYRLTLVGDVQVPTETLGQYSEFFEFRQSVPRADIPAIMASHHVLVFPSYFEGSALSLIEALASGLAIIQTRSSGNGATPETGVMLAQPDSAQLREAMLSAIEDREQLNHWRANAQAEARKYTFAQYRGSISSLLDDLAI